MMTVVVGECVILFIAKATAGVEVKKKKDTVLLSNNFNENECYQANDNNLPDDCDVL